MKSNIGFSIIQLANCHKFLNCIAVLGSLQCGENSVLDNQTIALSHELGGLSNRTSFQNRVHSQISFTPSIILQLTTVDR